MGDPVAAIPWIERAMRLDPFSAHHYYLDLVQALFMAERATEAIGVHAVFGAFLLGAVIPHDSRVARELTGKLGLRYEFTPAFALRGAISNNFRAPSLAQIGYESTSTGYNAAGQLVQGRVLSVNNPIARGLGATDL